MLSFKNMLLSSQKNRKRGGIARNSSVKLRAMCKNLLHWLLLLAVAMRCDDDDDAAAAVATKNHVAFTNTNSLGNIISRF